MIRSRRLAVLGALTLQFGCGLILRQPPEPIVAGQLPDPHRNDEPKSFAFAGEIRDFASFRLEPDARIEFWCDDPQYVPRGKLDGHGSFAVRFDACKQSTSAAEDAAIGVFVPDPSTCKKWIGRFAFRAKLGQRCSLPISDATPPPVVGDTLVLWLTNCIEQTGAHTWRPVPADDPQKLPPGP